MLSLVVHKLATGLKTELYDQMWQFTDTQVWSNSEVPIYVRLCVHIYIYIYIIHVFALNMCVWKWLISKVTKLN